MTRAHSNLPEPSADDLRRANEALAGRVAELEKTNREAQKSRLATLNVLEDATASRELAEDLNERLQRENQERRQVEQELRESKTRLEAALASATAANQTKEQFIAALSHELRTPLAPVLLAASLGARDEEFPTAARAKFDLIRANVEIEARLIDDLLDQTGIAHGQTRLTLAPANLHEILAEAIRTTATEFSAKQITPECRLNARETQVKADPLRLQQVFWNLLRNAAKFTPEGGRVIVETADLGDFRVAVRFIDSGIGLTTSEIHRIFRPFVQGDHAANASGPPFGGLGLGLSISRKLVELHHGLLTVTSAGRGCGACFTVELPSLGSASPSHPPHVSTPSSDSASPFRRLRVLLVEDHTATRIVLKNLLERRGHELTTAGSLTEAIAKSTGKEFDAVMSDLGLPDGTGCDLMRHLQIGQPGLVGIALSGYGMENDLKQTHDAGFSAHLIKPISVDRLEIALRIAEDKINQASRPSEPSAPAD